MFLREWEWGRKRKREKAQYKTMNHFFVQFKHDHNTQIKNGNKLEKPHDTKTLYILKRIISMVFYMKNLMSNFHIKNIHIKSVMVV